MIAKADEARDEDEKGVAALALLGLSTSHEYEEQAETAKRASKVLPNITPYSYLAFYAFINHPDNSFTSCCFFSLT